MNRWILPASLLIGVLLAGAGVAHADDPVVLTTPSVSTSSGSGTTVGLTGVGGEQTQLSPSQTTDAQAGSGTTAAADPESPSASLASDTVAAGDTDQAVVVSRTGNADDSQSLSVSNSTDPSADLCLRLVVSLGGAVDLSATCPGSAASIADGRGLVGAGRARAGLAADTVGAGSLSDASGTRSASLANSTSPNLDLCLALVTKLEGGPSLASACDGLLALPADSQGIALVSDDGGGLDLTTAGSVSQTDQQGDTQGADVENESSPVFDLCVLAGAAFNGDPAAFLAACGQPAAVSPPGEEAGPAAAAAPPGGEAAAGPAQPGEAAAAPAAAAAFEGAPGAEPVAPAPAPEVAGAERLPGAMPEVAGIERLPVTGGTLAFASGGLLALAGLGLWAGGRRLRP